MNNTIIIVGDAYSKFTHNEKVFTASQYLTKHYASSIEKSFKVILGQGISHSQKKYIIDTLDGLGIEYSNMTEPLADTVLTHKSSSGNVLITNPIKVSKRTYIYNLSISDDIDRLSDHVTGEHIGAMVLMEAARQAVIVTLEQEYSTGKAKKWGFILDSFCSNFSNYVYPLPTLIKVSLDEISKNDSQIVTVLTVYFEQVGQVVAKMQLNVNLYKYLILERIESRKAKHVVESYIYGVEKKSSHFYNTAAEETD